MRFATRTPSLYMYALLLLVLAIAVACGPAAQAPTATVTETDTSPPSPTSVVPQATAERESTATTGQTGENAADGWVSTNDIELILPYDAGGGFDKMARLIAPYLEKHLPGDANVLVRNVSGAGGAVGASQVYAAKPDGTVIGFTSLNSLPVADIINDANFDVTKFTYLGRLSPDQQALLVNANSDIDSIEDLKEREPIKFATTGISSSSGIAAVVLFDAADLDFITVMHDGGGEQRLSVIRGDTDAIVASIEAALEDVQAEDLKPIVYIGKERPAEGAPGHEEFADVPTLADLGYPEELADGLALHRGLFGPPDMPEDVKQAFDKAFQAAVADPEFVEEARELEISIDPLDAEGTTRIMQDVISTVEKYEPQLSEAIEKAGGR